MNSKKLQAKIQATRTNKVDLYKGHMMDGRFGWIMAEFGKNEIYLGKNLVEAFETVENWENK